MRLAGESQENIAAPQAEPPPCDLVGLAAADEIADLNRARMPMGFKPGHGPRVVVSAENRNGRNAEPAQIHFDPRAGFQGAIHV